MSHIETTFSWRSKLKRRRDKHIKLKIVSQALLNNLPFWMECSIFDWTKKKFPNNVSYITSTAYLLSSPQFTTIPLTSAVRIPSNTVQWTIGRYNKITFCHLFSRLTTPLIFHVRMFSELACSQQDTWEGECPGLDDEDLPAPQQSDGNCSSLSGVCDYRALDALALCDSLDVLAHDDDGGSNTIPCIYRHLNFR